MLCQERRVSIRLKEVKLIFSLQKAKKGSTSFLSGCPPSFYFTLAGKALTYFLVYFLICPKGLRDA